VSREAFFVVELDGPHDFQAFKLFAVARAGWIWGVAGIYYVAPERPQRFHPPDAEYPVTRVASVDEAISRHPDHRVVVVEQGGESIAGFNHPDQAIYVFGSDNDGTRAREGADHVSIVTPNPRGLYAHQAAAIVASDRFARADRPARKRRARR